jgi:hypothetical protein
MRTYGGLVWPAAAVAEIWGATYALNFGTNPPAGACAYLARAVLLLRAELMETGAVLIRPLMPSGTMFCDPNMDQNFVFWQY